MWGISLIVVQSYCNWVLYSQVLAKNPDHTVAHKQNDAQIARTIDKLWMIAMAKCAKDK